MTLKEKYYKVRKDHQQWLLDYDDAVARLTTYSDMLKDKLDAYQTLGILKELDASEKEIEKVKLRMVSTPSRRNADLIDNYVRLRPGCSLFNFGPYRKAKDIISGYIELAAELLKASIEVINNNPSVENEHKALCLARDLIRFKILMDRSVYSNEYDFSKIDVEDSKYMDFDIFNYDFLSVNNDDFIDTYYFKDESEPGADSWRFESRLLHTKVGCERVLTFIDRLTDYGLVSIK